MASALTNSNSIETDKHELESATIVSHDFFITFMVLFFTNHTASYDYEGCNGRYRNCRARNKSQDGNGFRYKC
ncbi:hypothetical protein DP200_25540, partial [Enterobacter hormaechei subsp. oharae]